MSRKEESDHLTACTVSRDIHNFDLLIEDMDSCLGEKWGDLPLSSALSYLKQPSAKHFEFIVVAIDADDEANIETVVNVIVAAKRQAIKVILVAEDVASAILHNLLSNGADEFAPYPLPDGELASAIEKIRLNKAQASAQAAAKGQLIIIQGTAGGVGASTITANLAYEMSLIAAKQNKKVTLIDMDLQFGAMATYLDVNRNANILQMWQNTGRVDEDSYAMAVSKAGDHLTVITDPAEIVPIDLIDGDDIEKIFTLALQDSDFVLVDLPNTLVSWTERVFKMSDVVYSVIENDMRSAQNLVRLNNLLEQEGILTSSLQYVMNRAPKITDLTGRSRAKRMAETLDINVVINLPDGGRQVTQSNDNGEALAVSNGSNALRKEIAAWAKKIIESAETKDKVA